MRGSSQRAHLSRLGCPGSTVWFSVSHAAQGQARCQLKIHHEFGSVEVTRGSDKRCLSDVVRQEPETSWVNENGRTGSRAGV